MISMNSVMLPLALQLYYLIAWSNSLLQAQYVSYDTRMDNSAEFVNIRLNSNLF